MRGGRLLRPSLATAFLAGGAWAQDGSTRGQASGIPDPIILEAIEACRTLLPRTDQWFGVLMAEGWVEPDRTEARALAREITWTSQAMAGIRDWFPGEADAIEQQSLDRLLTDKNRVILTHPGLPGIGLAMSLGPSWDGNGLSGFCDLSGAPNSALQAFAEDALGTQALRELHNDRFGSTYAIADGSDRQPIRFVLLDPQALSDSLGVTVTHPVGVNTLATTDESGERA